MAIQMVSIDRIKVKCDSTDARVRLSQSVCWCCTKGWFGERLGHAGLEVLRGNFEIDWVRGYVRCWPTIPVDGSMGMEPHIQSVESAPRHCKYLTEHVVSGPMTP